MGDNTTPPSYSPNVHDPPMQVHPSEKKFEAFREEMQQYIPIINTVFGPGYNATMHKCRVTDLCFYVKDVAGNNCLKFEFIKDKHGFVTMEVDNIDSCMGLKGEEIVPKVIQLARDHIHAHYIKLIDASRIHLNPEEKGYGSSPSFSLSTLKKLTTGQSWYNKFGFFCDPETHDTDIFQRNLKTINSTLENIIDKLSRFAQLSYLELFSEIKRFKESEIYGRFKEMKVVDFSRMIEDKLKSLSLPVSDISSDTDLQYYLLFLEIIHDCELVIFKGCVVLIYKVEESFVTHPPTSELFLSSVVVGGKIKKMRKTKKMKKLRKTKKLRKMKKTRQNRN
jgi:hypothetical protein